MLDRILSREGLTWLFVGLTMTTPVCAGIPTLDQGAPHAAVTPCKHAESDASVGVLRAATTIFVAANCSTEKKCPAVADEVRKGLQAWGRWKVVNSREDADLVVDILIGRVGYDWTFNSGPNWRASPTVSGVTGFVFRIIDRKNNELWTRDHDYRWTFSGPAAFFIKKVKSTMKEPRHN